MRDRVARWGLGAVVLMAACSCVAGWIVDGAPSRWIGGVYVETEAPASILGSGSENPLYGTNVYVEVEDETWVWEPQPAFTTPETPLWYAPSEVMALMLCDENASYLAQLEWTWFADEVNHVYGWTNTMTQAELEAVLSTPGIDPACSFFVDSYLPLHFDDLYVGRYMEPIRNVRLGGSSLGGTTWTTVSYLDESYVPWLEDAELTASVAGVAGVSAVPPGWDNHLDLFFDTTIPTDANGVVRFYGVKLTQYDVLVQGATSAWNRVLSGRETTNAIAIVQAESAALVSSEASTRSIADGNRYTKTESDARYATAAAAATVSGRVLSIEKGLRSNVRSVAAVAHGGTATASYGVSDWITVANTGLTVIALSGFPNVTTNGVSLQVALPRTGDVEWNFPVWWAREPPKPPCKVELQYEPAFTNGVWYGWQQSDPRTTGVIPYVSAWSNVVSGVATADTPGNTYSNAVFLRSFNTASAPTYTFETKPATGTVWSSYTLYQSSGKWQHAPIVSTFGLHDYRWKVTFADASYAYWPYHQTSGFLKLETRSYASFSWMVNNTDYDQYYPTSAGWYYKGKGNNYGTPYFGLQNVGYTISKWLISPKVGRIKELRFNQDGSTPGDAQTIVSRSTDGVNWTTVATFSSTLGGNPAARVATLNLSAENYIRIHPNNNTWNNYVRLVNAYLIPY